MNTKLYLSVLVLSLSTSLWAQDYSPFPLDQSTFWKTSNNKVALYYCDSLIHNNENESLLLFGAKYLSPEGPCRDSIINYFYYGTNEYVAPFLAPFVIPTVDSFSLQNQRLFPFGQAHSYFDLAAQQWTVINTEGADIDSIQWSLVDSTNIFYLEVEETVKVYQGLRYQNNIAVDTLSITLSKDHGFLEFIPFHQWWRIHPKTLDVHGWRTADNQAGFTHSFDDYFDIAVGTIIKHACYGVAFNIYRRDTIRDSIVYADLNAGGLNYTIHRQVRRTDYVVEHDPINIDTVYYFEDTLSAFIPRSDFTADFAGTPGWLFFQEDIFNGNWHWGYGLSDSLSFVADSLLRFYVNTGDAIYFESPACSVLPADSYQVQPFTLIENLGLVQGLLRYFPGYPSCDLLGFKLNGQGWGDYEPIPDIIVNSEEPLRQEEAFSISPNPSSGLLKISFNTPLKAASELYIYDAQGRLVHQQQLATLSKEQDLDLSFLKAGMYHIQLVGASFQTYRPFVKID